MQVLQVAEALLKQSDLLTGAGAKDLPFASPTATFLDHLAEHFSIIYDPGQVCAPARLCMQLLLSWTLRLPSWGAANGVTAKRNIEWQRLQGLRSSAAAWQVVQVPLPRTPAPVNVSPPRRLGSDFQPLQPLRRCGAFKTLQLAACGHAHGHTAL